MKVLVILDDVLLLKRIIHHSIKSFQKQHWQRFSQSQPQSDQPQPGYLLESHIWKCIHVCFSYEVSLIKTIINYCNWQFYWILFYSRKIVRFTLSQNMKCVYFMNKTISSKIASNNIKLWSLLNLLHRKNIIKYRIQWPEIDLIVAELAVAETQTPHALIWCVY